MPISSEVTRIYEKACNIIDTGSRSDPEAIFDFSCTSGIVLSSALSDMADLKSFSDAYGLLSGLFVCWDIEKDEPGAEIITKHLVDILKSVEFAVSDFKDVETLAESYLQKIEFAISKMLWLKNRMKLVPYFVAAGMEKGYSTFYDTKRLIESFRKASKRPKNGKQKA